MTKYLIGAIMLLCGVVVLLWHILVKVRNDRDRLKINQSVLMEEVHTYAFRDSLSAISVGALTLKVSELKTNTKDLMSIIEDLRIKAKRVESVTTSAFKTEITAETKIKDEVVEDYEPPDINVGNKIAKSFAWRDLHAEVTGRIMGDSIRLQVSTIDTLHQVVHRIPKRFLFFRWGVKAIRQEVFSSNPHSTIVYNEYIKVAR